jgi:hypothetical protein
MLLAARTALRIASTIASAASAPMRSTLTSPSRVPVASAKIVSPSPLVCEGTIARANPSCAIWATFLAWALVSFALVATTPSVVF